MNFIDFCSYSSHNSFDNKKNNINSDDYNNKILKCIYNSNNRIFKKNILAENEINSQINLTSPIIETKEIYFKLSPFSQQKQKVIFSNGIEEIYDDSSSISNDKLFFNISNKKYSTPPRNIKFSYKKTKEHIKTPYKTTKSHSSRNKSKSIENNYKSSISTKSITFWKSLIYNKERKNNISQEINIEINRTCNSVILDNPFINKKEYKLLITLEDNDEDLNKSF